MTNDVISRKSDESAALWMLGGLYEIKLGSDETGGRLTLMEMTVPVGTGPPPHMHDCNEAVYVIDGTLEYTINGETVEGGPGSTFHFPVGTLETFVATGDRPLRVLIAYIPGGIDRFFLEAGERAPARTLPPASVDPPDVDRLVTIAARHGLTIQPPG